MKAEITISASIPKNKFYKGIEFWEQEAWIQLCKFSPESEDQLRKTIEDKVLDWLKDDKADSVFEIRFFDKDGSPVFFPMMLWSRSEIYIKECANQWGVWRIATCSSYEKMISYKVKSVGTNDYQPDFRMPNEVRCQGYSSTEEQIWGLL